MAQNKVLAYLKEREGKEVPYEELAAAGLAPSAGTLHVDLSRLAAKPGSGVSAVGVKERGKRRPYRYDTPEPEPEPVYRTLRVIGRSAAGNELAQEGGELFEIIPLGRLDEGRQ